MSFVLIIVALGVAMGGAVLLLLESMRRGSLPGCGGGSGCEEVTKSRFGRLGPVPVAGLGIAVYGTLLIGRWWGFPSSVMHATAVAVIGAAVWFVFLQVSILRMICGWCMGVQGAAVVGAGIILGDGNVSGLSVTLGIAATGLMIVGQLALGRRTYAVVGATHASPTATTKSPKPRIELMKGAVSLSPHLWPMLGSIEARHILIDLFDYTCHDCRHFHGLLEEMVKKWPADVAVVLMPCPMEPRCNPAVVSLSPEHVNACDYARLALKVWKADQGSFAEFDHWMFQPPRPVSIETARARAEELIGKQRLDEAMDDPVIEKRLSESAAIYRAVGGGIIPKLLMPQAALYGRVPDLATLTDLLRQQLGISGQSIS